MKNIKKILGLMMAATILVGCGQSKADEAKDDVEQTEETSEEVAAFGERTVTEYPISEESQAKLGALETDYSKVNWQVEYEPIDGIVVSESMFVTDTKWGPTNHMIVAFTNLTDDSVKIDIEGYLENEDGEVAHDLVEDDIEIWAGNTVAREINFKFEVPSGNIKWNKITSEHLDREYVPYEIVPELEKGEKGYYSIKPNIVSDPEHQNSYRCTGECGLVLDKDGNILGGASDSSEWVMLLPMRVESFGGENTDVVFFCSAYKAL